MVMAQAAHGAHLTERLSTYCIRGLQGEGLEQKGQTSVRCDTQADPGAMQSCSRRSVPRAGLPILHPFPSC